MMRRAIGVLVLFGLVDFAFAADPPAVPGQANQNTLNLLEANWVLKSANISTPEGVVPVDLDGPNQPKREIRIKDGYQVLVNDGKPSPTPPCKLSFGTEPECLVVHGKPDQKPFRVRYKLDGDTLVLVQDMLFQEECPESFDPEKGRDRGRRVLVLTRETLKP